MSFIEFPTRGKEEKEKEKEKAKVEHFKKLDCRYTIHASHYTCSSDVGWAEWSRNVRLNTGKVFPLSVLSVSIFLHFFGIGRGGGVTSLSALQQAT
jgi:hypothetical protein